MVGIRARGAVTLVGLWGSALVGFGCASAAPAADDSVAVPVGDTQFMGPGAQVDPATATMPSSVAPSAVPPGLMGSGAPAAPIAPAPVAGTAGMFGGGDVGGVAGSPLSPAGVGASPTPVGAGSAPTGTAGGMAASPTTTTPAGAAGGGTAGGMAAGGAAAPSTPITPGEPRLPSSNGNCPRFGNGTTVKFGRMNVVVYMDPGAKSKPAPGGPIINYYHATLGLPSEVVNGFDGGLIGGGNIRKVTGMGGVVASYTSTTCNGCATTDDFYWYVEDYEIQDQVVACAIEQANINTKQIHALGWSAGALHATATAIQRSGYMASFVSYSGGLSPWPLQDVPQNPGDRVAGALTYGAVDWVVVDFPTQSKAYYNKFKPQGWYTMMCPTGGTHAIDAQLAPHALEFFLAHPFQISPSPYEQGIPAGFPRYCTNSI